MYIHNVCECMYRVYVRICIELYLHDQIDVDNQVATVCRAN